MMRICIARGFLGLRRDGMMEKASIVSIWKYIDVGNAWKSMMQ